MKVRRFGFTLIELLVVISVIALLMSISLPVIDKVRGIAKSTVCKANLRGAAIGFKMYLDEARDIMPPACRYPSLKINDKKAIAEFLLPFLSGEKSLWCPADNGKTREDYTETYFVTERSSYEYLQPLGGEKVEKSFLTNKLDFSMQEVHVLYDYDSFHGKRRELGSVNYLYADGHVGNREGE
jgi:prepilin-type N-terminal cleavage/methylation domain-containing protein/prepilin-type processing-associated H-X9-DG protein